MKLTKAIEILKGKPGPQFILEGKTAFLAAQLGIAALRYYQQERQRRGATKTMWLPGETEEDK